MFLSDVIIMKMYMSTIIADSISKPNYGENYNTDQKTSPYSSILGLKVTCQLLTLEWMIYLELIDNYLCMYNN